jgi:hypothetical protein
MTGDYADYTLKFTTHFDSYDPFVGTDPCGTEGATKGLRFFFSDTNLGSIPPGEYIEVPFYIDDPGNYCRAYNNLELQIVATCELKTAFTSEVFQYGYLNPGSGQPLQISYAESDAFHATNSTAFFSVQWPPWVNPIHRSLSTDSVSAGQMNAGLPVVTYQMIVLALAVMLVFAISTFVCGYLLGLSASKSRASGTHQEVMEPIPTADARELASFRSRATFV